MKAFKSKRRKSAKGEQADHKPVVGTIRRFPQALPRVIVIIGVVIIVAGAGWLLYKFIDGRNSNNKISNACSESVVTAQTAIDLSNSSVAVLKPTVDKILKTNNYNNDPSCLYILTKYYIGVSDPAKARPSYDQLTKLYTSNKVYDSDIRDVVAGPEQFKPVLELLEKEQQEIDKTSKVIQS